ncbi:MAG: GNAT family N-acetyltransferase [Defluviitaleaceae bacterium]|nr:GNAT family N-acetyltransferase [Defluviitaleaceae bacterium]
MITAKWVTLNELKNIAKESKIGAGFFETSTDTATQYIAAYADGEFAGMGYLLPGGKSERVKKYAAVHDNYRRSGIGNLIFRMLIRRAYNAGYKSSVVFTPPEAVAFFIKLGYVTFGSHGGLVEMRRDGDVFGVCS